MEINLKHVIGPFKCNFYTLLFYSDYKETPDCKGTLIIHRNLIFVLGCERYSDDFCEWEPTLLCVFLPVFQPCILIQ